MTVRKRSILPRLLIFIVLLVCAAWIWQNYFAYDENGRPPDRYRGDILTITGTSDADGDSIPDQQDILQGALDYVATRPRYKSAYFVGGWPTDGTGVCTDVVAYGMRAAGFDLPTLVDNDKRAAPENYFGVPPDKNIDYRRVPNLAVYFSRHATALTTDTSAIEQWQGGDIVRWVPEIRNPDDAARGYFLGAQLLAFLAPHSSVQTLTVPVADGIAERRVTDGVLDRDAIVAQTRAAVSMLRAGDPDRIMTFGGDCSVSAAPFAFLAGKYGDDAAVIWIDAHPDITLPGDAYSGYHAMALAACMGLGDAKILAELPARIDPSRVLLVGLRDWERDEIRARQRELGIAHLAPQDVAGDSRAVVEWLESCGASKVLIHFDLDVLDPADLVAAVGVVPDGMTVDQVVRLIGDIARAREVVGLTVAEPMPRTAVRIRDMLKRLPSLE